MIRVVIDGEKTEKQALEIHAVPGEFSGKSNLALAWTPLEITQTYFKIQLDFEDPEIVSAYNDADSIKAVFWDLKPLRADIDQIVYSCKDGNLENCYRITGDEEDEDKKEEENEETAEITDETTGETSEDDLKVLGSDSNTDGEASGDNGDPEGQFGGDREAPPDGEEPPSDAYGQDPPSDDEDPSLMDDDARLLQAFFFEDGSYVYMNDTIIQRFNNSYPLYGNFTVVPIEDTIFATKHKDALYSGYSLQRAIPRQFPIDRSRIVIITVTVLTFVLLAICVYSLLIAFLANESPVRLILSISHYSILLHLSMIRTQIPSMVLLYEQLNIAHLYKI